MSEIFDAILASMEFCLAASIALCADDELYNIEIRENKKEVFKWPTFKTNTRGKLEFS